MNTTTRTLLSLTVGAVLTGGVLAGCATPHTAQGYVSEVRATIPAVDNASITDQQLIQTGSMMCAYPDMLNSSETDDPNATPGAEYAEYTAITRDYCDVLPAAPMAPTPVGAESAPAPLPPTPIALGAPVALNYGGTDDPLTATINSVERCGADLVLDVTLVTGQTYSGQDNIAQSVSYADADGVTRMATTSMPTGSCYADYDYTTMLPYEHERKANKTYQGKLFYAIAPGEATTLELEGTDGLTRTLDVTGK